MLGKRKIETGARFVKVGALQPVVWVVEKVLDMPGLPNHVRLLKDGGRDSMTVSVEALLNPRLFRPAAD